MFCVQLTGAQTLNLWEKSWKSQSQAVYDPLITPRELIGLHRIQQVEETSDPSYMQSHE